jgi:hypothetical protein
MFKKWEKQQGTKIHVTTQDAPGGRHSLGKGVGRKTDIILLALL